MIGLIYHYYNDTGQTKKNSNASYQSILTKSTGSSQSIDIIFRNRDSIKSKCDKLPLFVFGNANGTVLACVILINIVGTNINIDNTTFISSYNEPKVTGSSNKIIISNLREYEFYTVIAPKGVQIDEYDDIICN